MNLLSGFADVNDNDIKECRNTKCSLNARPIFAPAISRCICGSRLKALSWRALKGGQEPYILNGAPKKEETTTMTTSNKWKAVAFFDYPGYDHIAYEEYLKKKGVVGFKTWNDWCHMSLTERPAGHDSSWPSYNQYLESIGIAPRKLAPKGEVMHQNAAKTGFQPPPPKKEETFTCSTPDVKGCPLLTKADEACIEMPAEMFRLWVHLAKKFDTEWLAYLLGTQREDRTWVIESMYYPKQKVTSGHVDVIEVKDGGDPVRDGTIGSVHSHVGMNAFFSAEDEKHFNHPVEIVVNRRGDIAISARRQLECGRFTRISGSIFLMNDEDYEPMEEALKGKLTPETPTAIVSTGSPALCNCSCGECKTGRHGCPNISCKRAKMCWCRCDLCDRGLHNCTNAACHIVHTKAA